MLRRTLLAAGTAALAGCSLGPSPPTTDGYPSTPPNFVGAFEWLPDDSAYRVRFDAGNRITADLAASITVNAGDPTVERTWVGGDDAVAEFPLEPGAELTVPVEAPGHVYVVWTPPDRERSVALDNWSVEQQPVEES